MADARPAPAGDTLVSLVIASRTGGGALLDSIDAFSRESDGRLEVIVAECAGDRTAAEVRARCPGVRLLHFRESRTLPDLRAAGMLAARGDIVALAGDRCRPAAGWLQALRRAHAGGRASAVGGAVEHGGRNRLLDWAVFFCEYGRFMLPFAPGESADLPAQNVSYSRAAIQTLSDLLEPATWEPLWHWRLATRGHTLVREPTIVVTLHKDFAFRAFVVERFRYGRSFAADRLAGRGTWRRLAYAGGTLLLPGVLVFRILRDVLRTRRHRVLLVCSAPYLAIFTIVCALGECVGALTGPGAGAHID